MLGLCIALLLVARPRPKGPPIPADTWVEWQRQQGDEYRKAAAAHLYGETEMEWAARFAMAIRVAKEG